VPIGRQGEMTWLLLRSGLCAPAHNMACDEALLEGVAQLGQPVLRFYGWTEPAATFGYFQKFAEAGRMTALRPLIRRPTGGGLVPHDADWTYSFVIPPDDPWYALKAAESYRRMHEWIRAAFAAMNVAAELSPGCRNDLPGHCFAGAEQFDVVLGERKLAGAAQRRTKNGLLIQGSIQPPAGIVRDRFEAAMRDAAARPWRVEWRDWKPGAELNQRARQLAQEKYSRNEFNCRR